MVSTKAALLYAPNEDYKIETVELDNPGPGEVLIQMRACGLCHSDEHARTGDMLDAALPGDLRARGCRRGRRGRAGCHVGRAR